MQVEINNHGHFSILPEFSVHIPARNEFELVNTKEETSQLFAVHSRLPPHQSPLPPRVVPPPIRCRWCDTHRLDLQRCGRCLIAAYCGEECLVKDWHLHVSECMVANSEA